MQYLSVLALVAATAFASPVVERQTGPRVTVRNGVVVGSTSNGVDSFKGIPFAEPPTGNLRLRPPVPLTRNFGTFDGTKNPRSCPQQSPNIDLTALGLPAGAVSMLLSTPFFQKVSNSGEDCLNLNVQRPSTATSKSKLPVVFYIYGGGFEFGSTSTYDGTNLIKKSQQYRKDVIYVAANYRVSGFGFLHGKELQAEGSTNLGLRDQRLALQWVADNIAAFGGDPDKVTIWGESAGSISVFDQTIINRGDNTYKGKRLFRAAVMDSGSAIPTVDVSHPKPQAVYDQVVAKAGCSGRPNTLACLRSVSYETLLNAVSSLPSIVSYESLNLAYLPRPDPSNDFFPVSPEQAAFELGNADPIPIIIGDQEDEGTLFSLTLNNVTTTEKLIDYFAAYFPDTPRSVVAGLVNTYDPSPSAGSPFNTGPFNELYPGFKLNAAVLGDATFTLTRRAYLANVAAKFPSWSYLSSYYYGTPVLGTFHATDILAIFFSAPPNVNEDILKYYISFFHGADPNGGLGSPNWPRWTDAGRDLINFKLTGPAPLKDTFREAPYRYLLQNSERLRV